MFGLFKKQKRIKISITDLSVYHSSIDNVSENLKEKELVIFLMLIFIRMHVSSHIFFKASKNDLTNIFKDIPKEVTFEDMKFEKIFELLIKSYKIGNKKLKSTTFTLLKGENAHLLNAGSTFTTDPTMFFYCATLLLLDKISDKNKFLYCLIDLAKEVDNRKISTREEIMLPMQIASVYYPS